MRQRRSPIPSYSQQVHKGKVLEIVAKTGRPILPGQERSPPPKDLDKKSALLWTEFMDSMPAGWFGRETFPLLRMLCRSVGTQQMIADKIDRLIDRLDFDDDEELKQMQLVASVLERQTRIVSHLACQLRLTPKSREEWRKKDQSNSPGTESQRRPWDADA